MIEYYRNNLTTLFFLEAQALLWVIWSFKMYKNLFTGTPGGIGDTNTHYTSSLLQHSGSGLLSGGVCPLGKFGAWASLIWAIILLVILTKEYAKGDIVKIEKLNKIMGWINISLVIIMFLTSLFMNPSLWVRTLPFFFTHIAITIILLNSCSKLK